MKIYKFGLYDYESNVDIQYIHSEDKTEEQFYQDIQSCMKSCFEELMESSFDEDGYIHWIQGGDWSILASMYMSKLGYKQPDSINIFIVDPGIIEYTDYDDEERNDKFIELVGQEFYQKAVNHNKLVRKSIGAI